MKKISNYLLSAFLSLLCMTAFSQYPSGFTAPDGIFILIDSTWHKNATTMVWRSENSGVFKLLATISSPPDESAFISLVKKAGADFKENPPAGDSAITKWWKGLNSDRPMQVFMMNPAGMIAAVAGYYDKTAAQAQHYTYKVSITSADGLLLKEGLTGDVRLTGTAFLPKPLYTGGKENDKVINVSWAYVPRKVPTFARVFRIGEGDKSFGELAMIGGFSAKGDSVFFRISDSLVKPGIIYKYVLKAWDWLGNPYPVSDTAVLRAWSVFSAPVIRMFHTKPVPEKHAIRLSWPLLEGQGMRGILIFRGTSYDGNFYNIATLSSSDTSYVDIVPLADENYWYFAVVANRFGYGLPSTRVFNMVTESSNPLKPPQPLLSTKPYGVELSWTYTGGIIRGYYVYRGEGYRGELKQLSDVIKPTAAVSYTDTSARPGNAYRYAIAAMGEGNGISPLSDAVSLMVPANGKISIPYNLRYRSDNSHITLFWENLLLTDGQVKAYTVYRRTGAEQGFTRITPSPKSAFTNTYTDSVTFGGKTAEYSVASIGPDGVESQKSAALTVELPLNEKIQINRISLIRNGESVIVRWPIVADKGLTGFKVFRFSETEEPVLIGMAKCGECQITDPSPLKGNVLNNYFVKAVYSDGSETEPEEIPAVRIP